MNKVLVKAQPTELMFSSSQLCLYLREIRSAPSVPLAGEQLVPSFSYRLEIKRSNFQRGSWSHMH